MDRSWWVDLRETIHGLRGEYVHASDATAKQLRSLLEPLGFRIYSIDGSKIVDERTLLKEATRGIELPKHSEMSWNDFDDGFGEIMLPPTRRIAILWEDAAAILHRDPQALVDAICRLHNYAEASRTIEESHGGPFQLEIFFLGLGGSDR